VPSFEPAVVIGSVSPASSVLIGVGDFDGDGWLDLLTVEFFSRALQVFWNDGHGAFDLREGTPVGTPSKDRPLA
jgi:hypothetical protein